MSEQTFEQRRISDVGWFWIGYFICAVGGWVAFLNWMVR